MVSGVAFVRGFRVSKLVKGEEQERCYFAWEGEVPNPQCEEWLEEMKATGRCYVDTKPPGKIALSLQARNPLWVHVLGVTMVVAVGLMLAHRLRR